ncbi:MAG: hypothetical protein ABIZ81_06295 [Opitutaceae bacterium]
MKYLFRLLLLSFCAVSTPSVYPAETKAIAEKDSAGAKRLAGTYAGKWMTDAIEGTLRLKLQQVGAAWTGESSFTYDGAEIPTKVVRVKVEGTKIEVVIAWDSQGTPAETRLTGELSGEKIEGTFQSKVANETTAGKWNATRT